MHELPKSMLQFSAIPFANRADARTSKKYVTVQCNPFRTHWNWSSEYWDHSTIFALEKDLQKSTNFFDFQTSDFSFWIFNANMTFNSYKFCSILFCNIFLESQCIRFIRRIHCNKFGQRKLWKRKIFILLIQGKYDGVPWIFFTSSYLILTVP